MSPYPHNTVSGINLVSVLSFTGKEWCKSQWLAQRGPERGISETGYGYFGARYYDSDLSGLFLSVDPMADKYPNISPYAYCAWNPVKLVDPYGKEVEDPPSKFDNIGPVIPKSDFIGWYYGDLEENCNTYAREQMSVAGYSVGGGADKTNIRPYNEKTGSNEAEFYKAVDYIKSCLENDIPVFVGVDDKKGSSNSDKTTDHFIVIVGMGYDEEKGNYFTAYDNATPYPKEGTSDQNRLYVDYENKMIQSDGKFPNNYARNLSRPYTVTQVRQSRKKKKYNLMKKIIFATLFVCTLSLQSIAQNIDSTIYCSLEFDKGVAVKDVVVECTGFGKGPVATVNVNDSSIAAINKSIKLNSNTAMGFRYNSKDYYISLHDRCLQESKSLFYEMMKSNVESIKIMITIAIYENVYYREDPYAVIIDFKRLY